MTEQSSIFVLVVDDENIVRRTVVALLRHQGYQAEGVASGAEASAWLQASPAQVVLIDRSMPDVDGLEFGVSLRGLYPDLALVLFSGGQHELGSDTVFDGVLDKPARGADLATAVQSALEHRRQARSS